MLLCSVIFHFLYASLFLKNCCAHELKSKKLFKSNRVKWPLKDIKIQISIIMCIFNQQYITEKHSTSRKWRSCHLGPGSATYFSILKEKKTLVSCPACPIQISQQGDTPGRIWTSQTELPTQLVWVPSPCVYCSWNTLGFSYDLWRKDNTLYPTRQLWD